MNESEAQIARQIKTWVWSGFYDRNHVREMLADIMEDDADADTLHKYTESEFTNKNLAEASWPPETDCDRLDSVFKQLNDERIVALQNAGVTLSDGHDDVGQVISDKPKGFYRGYCFYHGQDLERAVSGQPLYLAYGDLKDTEAGKKIVAEVICRALASSGFRHDWRGDIKERIAISAITWQRRFRPA